MNEIAAIATIIFFSESILPNSKEEKMIDSCANVSQELFFYLFLDYNH